MQDVIDTPWYRVPTVWLVISIPALTVAGCLLTMYLAVTNPDPVLPRIDDVEASESR